LTFFIDDNIPLSIKTIVEAKIHENVIIKGVAS